MKTKLFQYNTDGDYLILAFARIIGSKCFVNFMYSNDTDGVRVIEVDEIDVANIAKWATKNECEGLITPTATIYL